MVNVLSICLTTMLVLSFISTLIPTSVSAKGTENAYEMAVSEIEINSEELLAIADQYKDVETLVGEEADAHNVKIDDILLNEEMSEEIKREYLSELGVYCCYNYEETQLASSSSGDVTLNRPTIYYDSFTKEYVITGTGKWNAHTYETPSWSWWYPSVGDTSNIGGTDAIGISLSNTSGSTSGLALNSGYGYFYNGTATKMSTTLTSENDIYGGGYSVQDFIKYTKVVNYILYCDVTYYYNAYNMKCVLRYDADFAKYSGSAKLFYSHTWSNTSITGISLNKTGASLSWSNSSNRWAAYSYPRTFSKGVSTN